MSTEQDEVTFDAPVPKKKPKKKAKARTAAVAEPKSREPFPGLTRTLCADDCNAKGCVISGGSYCAHPAKGGLHASHMNDSAALKRLQRARAQIDVRIDPDRFS